MENLKLVIVGHVDHGKSTFIGRLLYDTDSLPEGKFEEIKSLCDSLGKEMEFGFVMDNFEEEREQGITIDTAQIFFRTKRREYTIIDAPGHVEFLKNMITGASQAEAAILIVDAKEGIQQQSRRHAYILSMLGINQVIIVMNKLDLISYSKNIFDKISSELKDFLNKVSIKPNHIIPISAKDGDMIAKRTGNLGWYDGPTVLEALDELDTKLPDNEKTLRLPVQDVYKQEERIIVGKITSGIIRQNDNIKILPSGELTEVKLIKEYMKKDVQEAEAGKSIGIVTKDKVFVDRGNIITHDDCNPVITDNITATLFWLQKKQYKKGERLLLRCATQEVRCEIREIKKIVDSSTLKTISIDALEINNNEVAEVVIKTAKPIVIDDFNDMPDLGRFVLEREEVCAGGIIMGIEK